LVVAGIAAAQHFESGAAVAQPPAQQGPREPLALNAAQVQPAIVSAAQPAQLQAQMPEPKAQASDDTIGATPTAEGLLSKARSEPRDDAWADRTTRVVQEDLGTKADKLKFHVVDVECRTTTCFAKLDWPSLSEAHADFKATLGAPNRADCHERLLFPQDANEDAPVEGILFLDCGRQLGRAPLDAQRQPPNGSAN